MTQTMIVTGASSGIGQAVAERMLAAGWIVGLAARRGDRLAAIAAPHGARAVLMPLDVTDAEAVAACFAEFAKDHGRLDVLFNNAGVFTPTAPLDEIDPADWRRAVDVNLTGMFLCARGLRADAPSKPAGRAHHQQRLGLGPCAARRRRPLYGHETRHQRADEADRA